MTLGLAGSLLGVVLARLASRPFRWRWARRRRSLLADVRLRRHVERGVAGRGRSACSCRCCSRSCRCCRCACVKPSLLLRDEAVRRRRRLGRASSAIVLVGAGARRPDRLAGGLAPGRGHRLRRLRRARVRAAVDGPAPRPRPRAAGRSRSFPLRHAVLHLSRPGNQTRVILLAVGLGAFFIVGVRSLQSSLLEEFSIEFDADAPDMFLMDVQRDQAEAMRAFLSDPALGAGPFRLIPVLRARVTGVDGRETTLESFEDVRAPGSLAREYTVTYRDAPRGERADRRRARSGPGRRPSPKCRSRRACAIGFRSTSATRSVRHPGPDRQRARHERPGRGLARFAERRLHVRVQAGRAGAGAADLHRAAARAGGSRRRGRAFSTTSSSSFPTSRSSTFSRS